MESYDFEAKARYRLKRESAIDRMCTKRRTARSVAYLDTGEALDTQFYLSRGYDPSRLWAINRNPAEVAVLTRRLDSLGLPRVNTVGMDFEEALERRVPEVDVLDFDGMANLHDGLMEMLQRISAVRRRAIFAVTLLGGREVKPSIWRTFVRVCPQFHQFRHIRDVDGLSRTPFNTPTLDTHYERVRIVSLFGLSGLEVPKDSGNRAVDEAAMEEWAARPCVTHVERLLWDVYVSTSRQPMVWLVAKLSPHHLLGPRQRLRLFHDTYWMSFPRCFEGDTARGELLQYIHSRGKTALQWNRPMKGWEWR